MGEANWLPAVLILGAIGVVAQVSNAVWNPPDERFAGWRS